MKKSLQVAVITGFLIVGSAPMAYAADTVAPSVPTGLVISNVTSTQLDLTWLPSTDDVGVAGYIVYRNFVEVARVTGTKFSDSGLKGSTSYFYQVKAYDAAGNTSVASGYATVNTPVPDTQPPTVPTNVQATKVDVDIVTITWSKSTDNNQVAGYRVYRNGELVYTSISNIFIDNNVTQGSTYTYKVIAYDASNNTSPASAPVTVNTPVDSEPPVLPKLITGYRDVTADVISWDVASDNMEVAGYEVFRSTDNINFVSVGITQSIELAIPYGDRNATYYYYVKAFDRAKNYSAPTNKIAVDDKIAPTAPANLVAQVDRSTGTPVLKLSWEPSTDDACVEGYDIYVSNNGINFTLAGTVSGTHYEETLVTGRTYYYYVKAYDSTNSSLESNTVTVSTDTADTQAPSVPTNVKTDSVTTTKVDISWTASTDNKAVTGYEVYRNGTKIGTATIASYSDTTVVPGTAYSYTVLAYDAAGNKSSQSTALAVNVPELPDTQAPTVPANVKTDSVTATKVDISWIASTDNKAVTGYEVYRNGTKIATTATTSYSDATVVPGTAYSYTVLAFDATGNKSAQSAALAVNVPELPDTQAPTVPTNVKTDSVTATKVDLSWTASTDNKAVTGYEVYRNGTKIGTTATASYSDTTVVPGTTYNYTVLALDAAGNKSAQSTALAVNVPELPDTQAPSVPANVKTDNVTATKVDLSWTASTDNKAVTGYEVYRNGTKIGTTATASYSDTTVVPGTTYNYTVLALDAAGNKSGQSTPLAVNVPELPDTQAPTIPANVKTDSVTATKVDLSWTASTDNKVVTGYEVYRNGTKIGTTATASYSDTTVVPGTAYSYTILAYDAAGNKSGQSTPLAVNVPELPDTQAPTIPANVKTDSVTATKVDLSWTASTDNKAVTGYEVYRNGTKIGTTATASYSDTTVVPGTAYSYTILAYDAAGNKSAQSTTLAVNVPELPDTQAPTIPANVKTDSVTATKVDLSWTASTDNKAVTGYEVYRNGTKIGTTATASYSDTTVVPGTTYNYTVLALDAAGNKSAQSTALAVNVPELPDTQAPSVPANVKTDNVTATKVDLSWTASTDNKAVTGYEVYRNGTKIGTTATASYSDTTVVPGTTYNYTVLALDAAGNKSGQSTPLAVNVPELPDTQAPTIPANVKTDSVTATKVDLSWTASTDNKVVTGYEVYRNGTKIGTTATASYSDTTVVPGTAYSYTILAYDAAGNKSGQSTPLAVNVPELPDTQAPTIPANVKTDSVTATKVDLSWTASTDNKAVTGYEVYRNGTKIGTTATASYSDTTVVPGTAYSYTILAYDAAGNKSAQSTTLAVNVPELPDTQAPTIPANVKTDSVTATKVDLSWTASTDNKAVTGYEVYRNGTKIGTTATASYSDTTVVPGTAYSYTILAYDAAGNKSAQSTTLAVNVPELPDTQAPTIPANVKTDSVTATKVELRWTASTDNKAVTGYEVYRNGTKIGTTATASYSDTTVVPGTAYSYTILAYDAAGNKSGQSTPLAVNVPELPDTQAPTIPANVKTDSVTATKVDLSWTASTDNKAVTGYEVYRNGTKIGTTATASYSDTTVVPGTAYSYTILAYDAAGNKSAQSTTLAVNVPELPDTQAPTIPANVKTDSVTATKVELRWTASTDNKAVTGYEVYRNGTKIGTTATASYSDTTVVPGTTYSYTVLALDAAGNKSAQSTSLAVNVPELPDTQAPTIPANVKTDSVTATKVELSWTASTDNKAVTGYEVYRNGTKIGTTATASYSDTTVVPGTTYNYTVLALDAAGNKSAQSTALAVNVPELPDTQAPTVPTNLKKDSVTATKVDISWTASTDNKAVTGYEVYRNGTKIGTTTTTSYSDTIVVPGTAYSYTVLALDATGNKSAQSAALAVNVPELPDTQAPTVPTNVKTDSVTATKVDLSWTASTDNKAVTGYEVYRNGTKIGTTATASYSDTTVVPGTAYSYTILALDAAGNKSAQSTALAVNVPELPDTQAPTVPTNLKKDSVTATKVDISWTASTDNKAVTGYEVYRNGTKIGTTTTTSYSDTIVVPGTAYSYTVLALDATGNKSAQSAALAVNVPELPDTQAPTVPTNVKTDSVTATKVDLSWTASTDNKAVTGYEVYRNGTKIGTTATASYSDTTVVPGTTYNYTVLALDAAGNKSAQSTTLAVNVPELPDTQAPTIPANVKTDSVTATKVELSWTASTDNKAVTGYEVYRNGTKIGTTVMASYSDTTVVPGTAYSYTVLAFDAAGNRSAESTALAVNVPELPDTQAPSTPSNLKQDNVTATQVDLSWTASTDNKAVTGYEVYRNGTKIGTTATASYSDTTVVPGTTYSYTVLALDAAGNKSAQSTALAVNVPELSDTQAPSVPANVKTNSVTATKVDLSWTASTDNKAVTGYEVYRDGSIIGTTTTASYSDTTVVPGTAYSYTVLACDAAGNKSNQSSALEVSIPEVPDTEAPTVPGGVAAPIVTATRVDLTWADSTDNRGVVGYEVFRDGVSLGMSTTTSFSDVTVVPGSSYSYTVVALDGAGNRSEQSAAINVAVPQLVDIEAPSIPGNLRSEGVSATSVNLSWAAATDNTAVVGYEILRDGQLIGSTSGINYTDNSVQPGATYVYTVVAVDAANNKSGASTPAVVVIPELLDTEPPTIPSELHYTNLSSTQVSLTWTPSTDNKGVAGYEIYRDGIKIGTSGVATFTDTKVTSNTTYTYTVLAFDQAGNKSVQSVGMVVNIPAVADRVAPSVPSSLKGTVLSPTSIKLTWNASKDNVGVVGYEIYRNGIKVATCDTNSYTDIGLKPNTQYRYYVKALDAAGNLSGSSSVIKSTTQKDTVAPSVPTGVVATAISEKLVELSWNGSTDNVEVSGYEIYRNGTKIATTANTNYSDSTTVSGTKYTYYVVAVDVSGLRSAKSTNVTVTTPGVLRDTVSPSTPSNLTARGISSSRIDLSWSASTDNVGVVGYEIYRNGVKIGTSTTSNFRDTNVKAGTKYTYYVVAYDAAGNKSSSSRQVTITASRSSSSGKR